MEIFKKINFKQFFTLIELIVVIVVLGVLAAIVIPNISSFKEEAEETAIKADARNIQTAVDMFMLDYHGQTPTQEKPSLGNPQIVELYGLKPDYLRDLPKEERAKFWLDENNTVWASLVDAPTEVNFSNGTLSWKTVDGADMYKVYTSADAETTAKAKGRGLILVEDQVEVSKGSSTQKFEQLDPLNKGTYLVAAVDKFGFESVPTKAGTSYEGYGEGPDKGHSLSTPSKPTEKPLYLFNSATFTNAGAIANIGPTQDQLNSAYKGTELEGQVISQGGIQLWTAPKTGTYRIETYGAHGGGTSGLGAILKADFLFDKGDEFKILIGQKGDGQRGGGGGTFISTTDNIPVIIAGGGGASSMVHSNSKASTSTSGNAGETYGGGKDGDGGIGGLVQTQTSKSVYAGGGGGFLNNGKSSTSLNGFSFLNGGKGGNGFDSGGFGGGAGGQNGRAYGGGGGYSGGGAGGNSGSMTSSYGGGGGSFISNEAVNVSTSDGKYNNNVNFNNKNIENINSWNTDHGKVIITYIGE